MEDILFLIFMGAIGLLFMYWGFLLWTKEKINIIKTYNESEQDGIVYTYYELNDKTWKCEDKIYQYRLELEGSLHNARKDSYYVVLTDNDKLSFEDVSKSLLSSFFDDSQVMKDSVIVEIK